MKALSSRLKVALLSAGISGLALVLFGVALWMRVYDLRVAAVDREIRTLAWRHPGLWSGRGNRERFAASLEFTFGADYTNRVVVMIKDDTGRTVYVSPHWPRDMDPEQFDLHLEDNPARKTGETMTMSKVPRFFTRRASASMWRLGVLGNEVVTLVIGLNFDEIEGELHHIRNAFVLLLPGALLLVGLGGWVVSGRALLPLKTIAQTAERVTARGLDQRIPDAGESPEAARLIQVLNRMMERLEASFRQATRFSADASHELKTPLAVMQGELENALHAAMPGSAEQQVYNNLLEEVQRLKTITRSLLLLAQADAGQMKVVCESLDVSAAVESLVEDARVLAVDSRLAFEVHIEPGMRVDADSSLLHTAIANLLTNAIKYNESGGKLGISLQRGRDNIRLLIWNTGPGIPPELHPRVFDRFYRFVRVDHPRIDGVGLGLSLAREIVRAHGGDLTMKESRPGMTCFELVMPQEVETG